MSTDRRLERICLLILSWTFGYNMYCWDIEVLHGSKLCVNHFSLTLTKLHSDYYKLAIPCVPCRTSSGCAIVNVIPGTMLPLIMEDICEDGICCWLSRIGVCVFMTMPRFCGSCAGALEIWVGVGGACRGAGAMGVMALATAATLAGEALTGTNLFFFGPLGGGGGPEPLNSPL